MKMPTHNSKTFGGAFAARNTAAASILPLLCLLAAIAAARADDPPRLDIHEWSVWLTEPTQNQINALAGYPSAMPGLVDTPRSRRPETEGPSVSPLSLISFSGKPADAVNLSLRMTNGRFLAHWPPADAKNNRLAWNDLKLTAPAAEAPYGFVPDDHWFARARQSNSLQVQRGSRVERFIAYDPELNVPLSLRVDGGPDRYQIINSGKYSLKDVLLIVPASKGRRIGWLDDLPAPKNPAPVKTPPAATGSPNPGGAAVAQALDAVKAATAQLRAASARMQSGADKPADGRFVKLVHVETGKALGIAGDSDEDSAQAELAQDEPNDTRIWKIEKDGDFFKLLNRKSGKVLDVQRESKSEGAAVIQWPDKAEVENQLTQDNQRWSWDGSGAERRLTNKLSNLVLDIDGTGKLVQRLADPGARRQLWRVVEVKEGVKDKSIDILAEVQMSTPLGIDQLNVQAITPLRDRLVAAGLTESETDLLLSLYSKSFFQSREPVLICRLPQATVDEWLPLEVDLGTAKITRVALVLCFKVDPLIRDQVQQLIEQLGDDDYANREQAERKLRDLGRMAIPALKEAVNSPDPERVMRAERLLLCQNERLDGK
jgi:hypothetical protein